MRNWRPIAIENYFKDAPDILKMWKVLEIKEEKQVPWYSDEPVAKSNKVQLFGICRTNFNPKNNWTHLMVVAGAIGLETLEIGSPIDINQAFKKVLNYLDNDQCQIFIS